ncbi:hypothetical protein C7S16_1475 [Burkholderia thailandensis]|uniref:Uncharacterized protein n=1 Tax=Burkholderia thailandensis TaxID=57975 RepID=A0AAW9D5Z7_BURTH|nr:hypothetical protein [Burkholderia thailandensis]MDW9257197.1 hypothetical protein [Burkholderia thailandensis]
MRLAQLRRDLSDGVRLASCRGQRYLSVVFGCFFVKGPVVGGPRLFVGCVRVCVNGL